MAEVAEHEEVGCRAYASVPAMSGRLPHWDACPIRARLQSVEPVAYEHFVARRLPVAMARFDELNAVEDPPEEPFRSATISDPTGLEVVPPKSTA